MEKVKKTVFSGIQPTGTVTLGNYLGALRNWIPLQDEYDCIYCIVDLHSITVRQEPAQLRHNAMSLLALYLASGISPEKSTVFVQSHVPAHAELAWALDTICYIGELNRMTQFKDKSAKHSDNLNMGLMNYPVLMASDILLYSTDLVPIGKDQTQHLELARNLAERFNNRYSPTFVVPEGFIPKLGAKIMSLQNPLAKMSKSDENPNGFISMLDDSDTIRRKMRRAVTDSDTEVRFSEDKPAISNLLTIYSLCSGVSVADAEKQFEGAGYGVFKDAVADAVIATLEPIQKRHKQLMADKDYLNEVLKQGAERANRIASKMVAKVYRKIGFLPKV